MVDHDPSGLDVARMIAQAAKGAPAPRKAKPRPQRNNQPRSAGEPQALGDALEELITDRGWSKEISLHHLLGRWPALVGPTNAEHSTPEHFAGGVLTVRTDSTAWATNLRLLAPQIVAKLNESVGQGSVQRIVVRGPDAPSWKHGIRSVRDGRGPRDTYG